MKLADRDVLLSLVPFVFSWCCATLCHHLRCDDSWLKKPFKRLNLANPSSDTVVKQPIHMSGFNQTNVGRGGEPDDLLERSEGQGVQ